MKHSNRTFGVSGGGIAAGMLCAALIFSSALAADPNLKNCVEQVHTVPLTQLSTSVISSVQDAGNVTVMDLSGDYDKGLTAPRQQVAAGFYAAHPDQYDFLIVFTTFEFPTGIAQAFYNPIRNDTSGTGQLTFDNSAAFGSTGGKLQGYVDMAAMSRYNFVSDSSGYEFALGTLAHELMHRWSAYAHFIDSHGDDSSDLIGQQNAHWSYFLDTDASLMYGADWRLQGDNKFHSIDIRHRFSPLDLYLAGFAAPGEVPPFSLIRNGDGGIAQDFPVLGAVSGGQSETITIDQVIAASGARVPSAASAQKNFTAAMILLKRPGEMVSQEKLLELERFRVRFQQEFVQMTGGRGIMRVYTQEQGAGTALPTILHGSGEAQAPSGVPGAIAWIESRQKADGHWEDRPATAIRDTVVVMRALSELDSSYPGISSARAWMAARGVENLDQRAWKLLGQNLAEDAIALSAAQDERGGFSIESGWTVSPLDTATVATALANHDPNSPALATALQLVGSQQNADGSFGVSNQGRGRVLPTLRAASLLSSSGGSAYLAARQRATDWLATQQSPDGGIGSIDQGSLPDTIETYSLLGRIQAAAQITSGTRTFVRRSQQISGDWGGSVYLTATAALAYAHDQRGNLAINGTPTANPEQPHDGEQVALTALVTNSGNIPAVATIARWFDGDPDSGGVQIGADVAVPSLASGSSATIKQNWDTTDRTGAHALWLVVDADNVINESSEQDNRTSIAITVDTPSSLPDLVLNSTDLALNPSSVASLPSVVHLSGVLRNLGAVSVSGAKVTVYAQPDVIHALASTTVAVAGRSFAVLSMDFNVTTPASLNLLVRADPDKAITEASETNNEANLILPFGQSLDLEVTPADVSQVELTPRVGRNIDFDVTLHNRGTVDSPPTTFHAEVEQNSATTTIFDAPVQIAAGQSQTRRVTWRTGQSGAAQLHVAIDPVNQVVETREDNNSAQLDFSVSALDQADLTFVSDSLAFIPTPGLQGKPLIASLGVRNLSSVATGSFRVALYAADPRTGAAALGIANVASLAGSSDATVTINVANPDINGDQTLYAFIDADNQIVEIDETNNIIIALLHVVPLPDVAIAVADMALTPALPVSGQPVQAQVTVRNIGGQDAHSVVVRLLEGDAATGNTVGADQNLTTLAAGASAVVTWNWTLGVVPNSRMVTAVADPDNTVREGSEDNNAARLPFDVQNGGFFANQRYISPNGDGVQDETAIVLVMPVAGAAEVDIVNGAQYAVRHFTNVQLNDALRGQVIWDGRDDRGRIVPDGDYHVAAIDANHLSHGGPLVTVDNNLSSVLEAFDTQYGVYAELPHDENNNTLYQAHIPPQASPLRDQLFGFLNSPTTGPGLYRTQTLFPNAIPVISGSWVKNFMVTQHLQRAEPDQFAFSPDGRELVFGLRGYPTGGGVKLWMLTSAVDQIDAPRALAVFDGMYSPLVLGYFDADTLVVGPSSDGMLQMVGAGTGSVVPLRSLPVDFATEVTIAPSGLLLSSAGGEKQVFLPRDPERAVIQLNSMTAVSETNSGIPDYAYFGRFSPQKTSVAIYERNSQEEKIDLVELASGSRHTLIQNVPRVATGELTGQKHSVGRYGIGWLEQQDTLLVQDAVTRRIVTFSEGGQQLGRTGFPALQRIGPYLVNGSTTSDLNQIFPLAPPDLLAADCNQALLDKSLGTERQVYDPTSNRLFLRFGEQVVHEEHGEYFYFVFDEGIRDYFSADVDVGAIDPVQQGTLTPLQLDADVAQHPLRQSCADTPPPDLPKLALRDGARIRSDLHVQTLSRGVLSKPWTDQISGIWPDETRVLLGSKTFSSLLNLTAVLQARTLGRGIELTGVATDRNFAYYQLDWAPIEQPNSWLVLTPASSDQIFLDEFLTWVPPQAGTFLIRLTVVDKAGNRTTTTASASSFDSSAIENFALAPRYFSPDGDGVQDQLIVNYRVRIPLTLDIHINEANGNPVRTESITYDNTSLGPREFNWDGRNSSGQVVPDGRYRINVDGFAAWVTVDNTPPVLTGSITQAYQPVKDCDITTGCRHDLVGVNPHVQYAGQDANLDVLVVEYAPKSGGAWLPALDPLGPKVGSYTFRVSASDRAGNASSLIVGSGEEQLILTGVGGKQAGGAVAYQPVPVTGLLYVNTNPPIIAIPVDQGTNDLLGFADESGYLTRVAVETAPPDAPDQWTERGSEDINDGCSPTTGCFAKLDTTAMPLGLPAFVRLRGERTDGSRLYSNQGYIKVGGIDPPACDNIVGPDIYVHALEYFDGPLADAKLHFGDGSLVTLEDVPSIRDDQVFFVARASRDDIVWVEAIDSRGIKHKSKSAPLLCPSTGGSGSALLFELQPHPVVSRDQCDGQPGNNIALGVTTALTDPDQFVPSESRFLGKLPTHLHLTYVDGITNLSVVLFDGNVDDANRGVVGQRLTIPTAQWPEGAYQAKLQATDPDGTVHIATVQMPVLKHAPQSDILSPTSGQRVCSLPSTQTGTDRLPVGIEVNSPAESAFHIEIGSGAHPVTWDCKADAGGMYDPDVRCGSLLNIVDLNGHSGQRSVSIEALGASYNGIATLRLKSAGWSGGTTCVDSTIYLDSDVEVLQRAEPTTYLPITGYRLLGISRMGDPKFVQSKFFLKALEPVEVAFTLHNDFDPDSFATLKHVDSVEGDIDLTWDGLVDGEPVPDGNYSVVVSAVDGCAHDKKIIDRYPIVVDSTPPALTLQMLDAGTSTAAAVIQIVGTATDNLYLTSWSLDVALAASPNNWQKLAHGDSPIIDPAVLKAWSRGSLTGAVDIRLSAVDVMGNRSETHLPLTLLDPAKLIASAELQPMLFSPNADGKLDTTRLQLSLLQKATVSITANDVPLPAGVASAGTTGYVWDGKDGAGNVLADGTYPVVVNATDPNGVTSPETATLTATIDNTPPTVTILQPTGAFAAGDSSIRIHVEDVHFASYDATLTRTADNVVFASATGTQGGDVTLTALQGFQEGAYALHVVARDGAGNVTTRDAPFQLDATAPIVTLTSPNDSALVPAATSTSVKGSVNDAHVAAWTLSVAPETVDTWTDLAHGTANIDPGEILAWTPTLPDGRYRLRLRGVDQAGNTTDVVHAVEGDGTPPVAHIASPVAGSVVHANFEIDGTATDTHFANYRVSVIQASQLASGQWADVFVGTTPVNNAKLAALTLGLADDNYVLRLLVTDKVGLSSSDQVAVRIDTQPPPVPLGLIGHVNNHRDSVLDWTAVSASDLSGYYVYRGGAKITPAPIAAIHYVDQNAPEGNIPYYVTAVDQAGNESTATNTVTLLIDHTPPTVAIAKPSPAERVRGFYDIIGTAYSHDDFRQYRLTAQQLSPARPAIVLASSTLAVQGQKLASWNTGDNAPEATVRIHLEAEDTSGNIGAIDVDVVVDNLRPAKPTGLTVVLAGADVQTHWNPNTESDLLGYLLYRDNVLVNATGAFLPADLRPYALADNSYLDKTVPDGTHTYIVYAIDRASNVSPPSDPATLDPIDGHPPSMVIEQPADGTKFQTSITVLTTSPDSDIAQVQFAWRAQGANTWNDFGAPLTSAPYRVVWTPPQGTPYGNYQIRALARDLGGRVDPAPPLVNVIYADLTPPDAPTHPAAHADADTVHVTWTTSVAADLAGYRIYRGYYQLNSTLITATTYDDPGLGDAGYTYTVTAVDNYGNESAPSASATAHVFSIALDQPYSPVSVATVDIAGTSATAGNIGVHVDTDQGSADSTAGATSDSGAIVLNARSLALGGNHITVRVTDSNGDISRPADIWVDRGNIPVAPTGVAAAVADHTVNLGWNATSESDLLGYRVFRNGHAAVPDAAVGETPAASSPYFNPDAVIDGDPQTTWNVDYFFFDPDTSSNDPWLELDWTQPHVLTAVNLTWGSLDAATGNLDFYAWSGHAWIRVARVRGSASATQSIEFDQPYRTTKLKLVVHGASSNTNYQSLQLTELQVRERPVQSATALAETVIDGTYQYRVSALSNFAFESPLSSEALATVGDPQSNTAVVLSGTLTGNDASLSWTASASPAVTRYDLQRDGRVIDSISASDLLAYVDHGLGNGTHLYVIYAYDAVGNASAPSNTVSLTVSGFGPGVPIGLSVTAPTTGGELEESWQPGTGTTPDHYILRRSTSSGGPFVEVVQQSDTTYFDGGLINGTTYWYTVEAVDAKGLFSGQSAPVSGTPNDHVPPPAPVLTYPTVAGDPLTLHATSSEVCGLAEAGAAIAIDRDGVTVASVTDDGSSAQFSADNSDHLLPAPDGRHLASVDYNGVIHVVGIDNFVSAYTSDGNTRLQSWAAHGMTLYYAASGADDLFRWELGQTPQAIAQPITQVSVFAIGADESTVAIAGIYTPIGGTATNGVWLIARTGGIPKRIGTLDPAALDASHPLLWSPDGAHLLVVDGAGSASIVDVASASVVMPLNFDTTVQPSWRADGKQLAYARANAQSGDDIVLFTLATQAEAALIQGLNDLHALAWSPANDAVAFVAGSTLQIVAIADGTSPLNLFTSNWPQVTWTASGRIVANDSSNGIYVDQPGWFCADSVPLAVGANHVSASATDTAGLRSISSAAVEIDTPTDSLPDLAVATSDILFLPPSGQIGQSYSALVTLHNLGTQDVGQPVLPATLIAPDGSQQHLLPTAPLSALAANGGVESVTYTLGTLSLPGAYRLNVVADPDNQLREANESNNSASSTLTLSADGKPVLELSLSRSLFAPGDAVTAEVAVTNTGSSLNGRVHTAVLDAGNALVADLGDLPIVALGFGQRWSSPVTWNAQGVFAGDYHMRAQLFGADGGSIADDTSAFTIAAVRHVQLALTPDATSQTIGHAVDLHSALNFSDGNALLSGATLRLVALDPNGVEVWHTQQTLGTLLPGYVLGRDDVWPTAGLVEGVYTLRLSMISPDLTQSTDATVAFTAPAPSIALGGSLSFDPGTTLIAGGDIVLHYNVTNQGGASLSGVQARLRIVAGQNQTPVSEQDDQYDLTIGVTHAATLTFTAPPLALVSHAAILEAHLASDAPGQWRLLAQQGFAVVDLLPPVIGVLSPPIDVVQPAVVPFRAAIVEQHSAVASAEISIDGGNWQPVSAGADGYYARGLAGLIDGAHTLSVRASDTWGNQAQTAALPFTVDATPPLIVIGGVADGDVVNHAVTPTVTITDAHLKTTDVRMNGNPFTSGAIVDQDGSYVLTARADDVAGNRSLASVRFTVDRTAPAVAITSPLDGATVGQSAIHVDVQTEAAAKVTLATGNYQTLGTADAQGHTGFDNVPLALGANPITATAADAAGNVSGPAGITVTYDQNAIAPLTGTLQPDVSQLAYGNMLGVSLLVHNPNASTLAAQQLRVRAVDATQTVLSVQTITHDFGPSENYSTTLDFVSTTWPLGALTLTLELNQSGIWTALDTKQITVVDRTPPLIALTGPTEGAVLHGPVTVTGTASDALTGIASVEERIDSGDLTALNASGGGAYTSALLALADGDHQAELQAHDGAGNLASVSPVHFAIDSVPPLINIAGVADGDLLAHSASPTITIADLHLSTSDVRLNGQPYVSGSVINASGDYRIDVSAADAAGNQNSASVHFTLDLDPPTVVFTAPAANAIVATPSIEVIGNAEALAKVHLMTGGFSVVTVADAAGVFDVTGVPLQAGANTLTAHAIDKAGNLGPDATRVVTYQTAGLTGTVGPLAAQIPRGLLLDVRYTLHNTGNVAFAALPLRIELHLAAGGDAVVSDDFSTDIAGGADDTGTRHLATTTLAAGDYTAVLLANMPATPGPGGWITLDSATTLVFIDPCRRVGIDVIFANGFETGAASFGDVIFCNGFEQLLSRPSAAKSLVLRANNVAMAFWHATTDAIPVIRVVGTAVGSELASVSALHASGRDASVTEKAWHLPYSRAEATPDDDDPHRLDTFAGVAAVLAPNQVLRELR